MMRDDVRPSEVLTSELLRSSRGRAVRPKTAGQKAYADAIARNIVTFGIGPAGTGKSYLAVALAVQALQARQVSRIILTRPAVEAGERLGFLPGDMLAKVDPYLRPLYDALHDLLEAEGAQRLIDKGAVEVAPLAFMRGRTLNNSFIILDEAQNTSPEQMKMFLTRIGFGSKAVVTGDMTQVDIPGGRSGLVGLEAVLGGVPDLAFVHLKAQDVVRHRIVADIVVRLRPGDTGRQRPGGQRVGRREPGVTLDIYAADEQADHPVAVDRWAALARAVLEAEGITADTEVSLLFIDEPSIAALNERFLDKQGPTDVLSFPIEDEIDRSGRSPDEGGTGPASIEAADRAPPAARRRGHLPGGGRRQRRGARGRPSTTRSPCWSCTGSSTCSAWTTRSTRRPSGWSGASSSCSTASTGCPRCSTPRDPDDSPPPSPPEDVVLIVVVVVLLAASALLALAETALVRMGRAKAKSLADDGRRGAKVLVRLTEDPQGFLNPVLLLVLICQLVVATLVGILAVRWFGAWGVVAATVFEIVVIFVFAEAVPKNWAVHHPERAALFSAPLVSAVVGFWPVRMVSGGLIGLANLFIGKQGRLRRRRWSPSPSCWPWPTWPSRGTSSRPRNAPSSTRSSSSATPWSAR